MKAAIGLDNWKLPIFRDRLSAAGFSYNDGGAITGDTTLLTVETDDLLALQKTIVNCEAECKKQKARP